MTPERWQEIDELFHAALQLSVADRTALLLRHNPDVRFAVEKMLLQEATGGAVFDQPTWKHTTTSLVLRTRDLAAGTELGPYRVESTIGAGGMGTVYRAKDTRLNRDVAIKTSAAEFGQRFEREAKTVASLNHPNICQIFDVGPNYLVMELIEGRPIVSSESPQPLVPDRAVRMALQIARALEAAHGKGIIHRDLKPANILVTSADVVKLLDFGLAKQVGPEAMDDQTRSIALTQAGMIIGTPAYMSPEQAEGKVADERSDIFSFGAVLYQMLTGRRAFSGGSAAAIIGAIVHKEPEPFDAPPALAAVVRKCLAKSPGARFQSATELRTALEAVSTKASSPIRARILATLGIAAVAYLTVFIYLRVSHAEGRIDSIAILPLDIKSNDPDADYISDGITESVNNSLARLPGLTVVPHSITLRYKGNKNDIQKVGAALNVKAILTGHILQRGDRLTVAVELDDVAKGKQIWGDRYNRGITDLLAIQTEIAREVSQRLRSQLSAEDQRNLAKGSTENSEAYQLYLKGKYHTSKFTREGFGKGIDYFNQALAKDPGYGLAYSGLAYYYILQDDWYLSPNDAAFRAKAAARKALDIDESNSDAHLALAMETQWYEWDWPTAEREFKRAIELNPKSSDAHALYAWLLAPLKRKDEAITLAAEGQRLDPLSQLGNFVPGSISVFTRQWDRASQQLRAAIDLDATYWFDHVFLGRVYEQQGKVQQALASFTQASKLDQDHAEVWSALGHGFAISGNRPEAQKVLDRLQDPSALSYVAPYNIAIVYAGLGDKDQTFAWLDRAYKQRSYYLPTYLTTDARLDKLHTDPRFAELRRRVGLPE